MEIKMQVNELNCVCHTRMSQTTQLVPTCLCVYERWDEYTYH